MPEGITIETCTLCNSKCIICPNGYNSRSSYFMPIPEFKRILKFFPHLKGVALCGMYEPLADSRLDEILTAVSYTQPQVEVTIFTNGSLLNERNREILLSHANIKNIIVSIHGYTAETYERIMVGLKRDTVYENVHSLAKERFEYQNLLSDKVEPRISVSFVRIKQNIHELAAFRQFWKDKVDVISDFEVMNWRGQVPAEELLYEQPMHTRACPMFEQPLVIDAYGNVVRCCYDFTFNYGHVLHGGLEKWQNKKWESETYPTSECKTCLGWHYY